MLITYLRSSSYNAEAGCQHSYFLNYVLSMNFPSGKKACLGNIGHKSMELVSRKKICLQNGWEGYQDDNFGYIKEKDINPDMALDKSFDYYKELESFHKWEKGDRELCRGQFFNMLNLNNGAFNPMNLDIINAEQRFDIEINKPWSDYKYDLGNDIIEGKLFLKGTVDLITKEDNDTLIFTDYKFGRRLDWNSGEIKTFSKLSKDQQLLMYYYCLKTIFPEYKNFIANIIYITDGGAFTFPFNKNDFVYAEELIRNKFEKIKRTQKPKLNKTWKCKALCPYFKNKYRDTDISLCDFFAKEVHSKGADQVFIEHGSIEKLTSYGSGGGRSTDTAGPGQPEGREKTC